MRASRRPPGQGGFGFVEVVLVLLLVAIAGFAVFHYLGLSIGALGTAQGRPLPGARLAADQATLGQVQRAIRTHYAQHGQWPADKAAVLALFPSPPTLQCTGNDFDYDSKSGAVRLIVVDPGRC